MDLKEKLDRQISRTVRDAVIQLSRDQVPDAGSLALAIASGQTAETLVRQAQEKIDRRTVHPESPNAPLAKDGAKPFVHPLTPGHLIPAETSHAPASTDAPQEPAHEQHPAK